MIVTGKLAEVKSVSAKRSNALIFTIAILVTAMFLYVSGMILYNCLFERFRIWYLITGILFFSISVFLIVILCKDASANCLLTVDESGLHHFHRGKAEPISSILFKNLVNSDIHGKKGIYLDCTPDSEVQGIKIFLHDGTSLVLSFNNPCRSLAGTYKNKKELIAAFLQGVRIINPQIIIDDDVFTFYQIPKRTTV